MSKVKLALIGAGARGRYTYADFIKNNKDICEIVALVEPKIGRRNITKEMFNLSDEAVFEDIDDFFKKDKMADAVIVCSSDNTHFEISAMALQKDYHVLVEGPVANTLDKLMHLKDVCDDNKNKVLMAVMPYRYSDLFKKVQQIIESKELGSLVNINYNSYIGYEKFVHNYVRGNWRLDSDTAPILLTNSCYDIDILQQLTNSKCDKISSFGQLNHFMRNNLRLDMSELCIRCSRDNDCPYYAQKIYKEHEEMTKALHINPTKENIEYVLKEGRYGQCIYACDNNVEDNMVSILKFKNNVTATLNVCAFTKEEDKNITLMFTHGEMYINLKENTITIKKFIEKENKVLKFNEDKIEEIILRDFIQRIENEDIQNLNSSVDSTIDSHVVAFAGEFANVSESVVDIDKFWEESCEMTKNIEKLLF